MQNTQLKSLESETRNVGYTLKNVQFPNSCVYLNCVEYKSDKLLNGIFKYFILLMSGPGHRASNHQKANSVTV